MTDQELRDLVTETFKGIKELKESQVKTDAQLAKTDAKLNKVAEMLGNIGNNQGDVAEEFFYNTLADKKVLAGVRYDFVDHNWRHRVGNVTDEFDIVMVNGEDVAIIEVKYKAHDRDLDKLINKKYKNFKLLYPQYRDFKHHLVLATFNINEELKERALEEGVVVLQRKGDTVETFIKAA
ncbi:MAG: hypothetical protein ACOC08_06865 [Campylobacterales bacterium]